MRLKSCVHLVTSRAARSAVAAAVLGSAVAVPVGAQGPARSDAWQPVDCATFKLKHLPAGSGVECGYVTVPWRHAEPDGPTIQLATVILPSHSSERQPDPLFMAQGGPGGSTIETYASYLINSPEDRPTANRDIVLWDQRGTLNSRPALTCPEVRAAELAAMQQVDQTDTTAAVAPYLACGERLKAEVGDLSAFNSAENADDIESLRAALGYPELNFYGVSYGTELGQFLMRRQPAHLRSVILDAVVPLSYDLFTEPAFAKQRIADKYFEACAAEPRCNAAFPNLRERYQALYERLNADPVELTVAPLKPLAETHPVRLDGEGFESALYQALYTDAHAVVPLIVDRAAQGDFTFVAGFLLPLTLFDETFAEAMHLTVACADRADSDPEAADYSAINPRLAEQERDSARAELSLCRAWDIDLLPRTDLEPVQSETPVLLLSGDYDPITPPQYAAQLLPHLPEAQHVVFPLGAHGQAVTSACANRLIAAFLDDPQARLDSTCVPGDAPSFTTEDDVITLPALRQALLSGGLLSGSMARFALTSVPGLLGALFLLGAVLVYPLAWLVARLRHRPPSGVTAGWTVGWARAAPWLAVAAGGALLAFLVGLVIAIGTTVMTEQNLFMLGSISAQWRLLFALPFLVVLLVGLMAVSAVALWRGHHGSRLGRVYYTLLVLAGLVGTLSLAGLGAFRPMLG